MIPFEDHEQRVSSVYVERGGGDVSESNLDHRSSLPLFAQLTERLQERLEHGLRSGTLKPGDFFATEKALCRDYGVSTITAKRALDELESLGRVVRHRGRGTFVASPRVTQVLEHFYRFTTEMQKQGFHPSWKNLRLGVEKATPIVRRPLALADGERVLRIERLRFLNDEPFFLHTSYLPERLFPGLEHEDHDNVALYDLLARKYNTSPVRCQDSFEPILVRAEAAQLLQVPPRSAGMWLERIAFSVEGIPIEYSRGVIRGDRCQLRVELK